MSAYAVSARGLASRRVPQGVLMPMNELLFGSGEQGALYDPSNLSTLFQDSAFTVPVTAVEQPVGGMLDLSGRGNHASMKTTTKRSIYSRRYNLLTKTEQFDDAAWGKVLCSVTPNSSIAPDGNLTADLIIPGASSGARYVSIAGSGNSIYKVRIKNGGLRYAAFGNAVANTVVDLDSGTISTTSKAGMSFAITGLGDGWYEVTCTNPTAAAYQYQLFAGVDGTGGNIATDGVSGIYVWGASLTLATDAHLPYQRVNTASDYDADPSKFPAYLRFEVDDALQTGNIDFTGTDKMTVWAGVWAPPDDGRSSAIVCIPDTSISRYWLGHPFSGFTYSAAAGATTERSISAPFVADNAIITASLDLAGVQKVAINGGTPLVNAGGTGGGNFRNAPMRIGADILINRFYFNGRLYSLIVRGAQSSLSQIEATEAYIKQKMRLP